MTLSLNDLGDVVQDLGTMVNDFKNKRVVIAGAMGFLGHGFLNVFQYLNSEFNLNITIDALDIKSQSEVQWAKKMQDCSKNGINFHVFDISNPQNFKELGKFDYFIHGASIASPTFYRQFPLETIKANIFGLFNLLEYSSEHCPLAKILFFSSSEVYGDPEINHIPTEEDYVGRVSFTGPRACYDESKRLGETICVNFYQQHGLKVKIVRPFNNYGPGLPLEDRRLIPDICKSIFAEKDITLFSDGSPTRTFCYISDALKGYFRTLLRGKAGQPYNIGNNKPEIDVTSVAEIFRSQAEKLLGYSQKIVCSTSNEIVYLTDNPNRRCPDLTLAFNDLDFKPCVDIETGAHRTLNWYLQEQLR